MRSAQWCVNTVYVVNTQVSLRLSRTRRDQKEFRTDTRQECISPTKGTKVDSKLMFNGLNKTEVYICTAYPLETCSSEACGPIVYSTSSLNSTYPPHWIQPLVATPCTHSLLLLFIQIQYLINHLADYIPSQNSKLGPWRSKCLHVLRNKFTVVLVSKIFTCYEKIYLIAKDWIISKRWTTC